MKTSGNLLGVVVILLTSIAISFTGCSDSDDAKPSYPKRVSIEYKLTATGSVDKVSVVSYTNATGGTATLTDVPLPFSVSVTREVNRMDVILLGALHNNSATNTPFELKYEIFVDGKLVETKTHSGTTAVNASVVYGFQ